MSNEPTEPEREEPEDSEPENCGYELNDPKHPTWRERNLDAADCVGDFDYDLGN